MTTEQKAVAYRHLHEDGYEYYDAPTGSDCADCEPLYAAAELRRLHVVNQELLEALKTAGLFAALVLHHAWCDVQMNEYSFEKLNQTMTLVDAAIAKAEGQA